MEKPKVRRWVMHSVMVRQREKPKVKGWRWVKPKEMRWVMPMVTPMGWQKEMHSDLVKPTVMRWKKSMPP